MDAERLDWDDVRVFLQIARSGSLTEAAAQLRISQPTAGRRLRALEAALGAALFDRLPNELVPTPLGRELAVLAEGMADGAAALLRRAQAAAAAPALPVRITATGSVSLFLAGQAGALMAGAPGAEIVLAATRDTLNLAMREAEIALRMRRPPASGDLVVRRLGRIAFGLYGARRYLAERTAAEIAAGRLNYIGLAAGGRAESQSAWVDRAAAEGWMRLRLADVALRHRAVADGVGVSLLPCFLGDGDPGLLRLGPPPEALVEDIHLLIHRDLRDSPPVRAVANALIRLFRAQGPALRGEAGRPEEGGPGGAGADGA
ncbi:MAG TPA: LysR family transcriptional regulator [Alphaproteobacteria bacterium]|nr:LysR family transcriptional regulator [Alphaproteobacteria bacterium]